MMIADAKVDIGKQHDMKWTGTGLNSTIDAIAMLDQ